MVFVIPCTLVPLQQFEHSMFERKHLFEEDFQIFLGPEEVHMVYYQLHYIPEYFPSAHFYRFVMKLVVKPLNFCPLSMLIRPGFSQDENSFLQRSFRFQKPNTLANFDHLSL